MDGREERSVLIREGAGRSGNDENPCPPILLKFQESALGDAKHIQIGAATTTTLVLDDFMAMSSFHRVDGARRRGHGVPFDPAGRALYRANRCSVVQRPCWRVFQRWCVSSLQRASSLRKGGLMETG